MASKKLISFFQENLHQWASENLRPMPWKNEKNPYLIWLSEIILQQTRVEQGLPYFEKFKTKYPTVKDLADAPEDEVMKMWEGLGYYSRARNLHFTAKTISNELGGVFPSNFDSIKKLKGVGDYTASAIASFAYDLPYAVLDGNVYRVFSRILGIKTPIDSSQGKKEFTKVTAEFLDKKHPAKYNQAIMDFGATQCLPAKPDCETCPFRENCFAFENNEISNLPVKVKKIKKRTRYFNFLIFEQGENTWIQRREEKDIWQKLYQFPLIETDIQIDDFSDFQKKEEWKDFFKKNDFNLVSKSNPYRHILTHQNIIGTFWKIEIRSTTKPKFKPSYITIAKSNLSKHAFPRIIDLYLNDKTLTLNLI